MVVSGIPRISLEGAELDLSPIGLALEESPALRQASFCCRFSSASLRLPGIRRRLLE
jgi:hypothetical protein